MSKRKEYKPLEAEVIFFGNADIITASGGTSGTGSNSASSAEDETRLPII